MAVKDAQKIQTYQSRLLTRREAAAVGYKNRMELFDGDNSSGQTFRLEKKARLILGVYELYDGTTEYGPEDGKILKQVAALSSETRGYTFTEADLITMGDGSDGYKPADSSAKDYYGLMVHYVLKEFHEESTEVRVTGQTVNDDTVPDTDTIIYCRGAKRASVEVDTTNFSTNTPNIDVKIIGSFDGVVFDTAGEYVVQPVTALAEAKVVTKPINVESLHSVKVRVDVNDSTIDGTEYAQVTVTPQWVLNE